MYIHILHVFIYASYLVSFWVRGEEKRKRKGNCVKSVKNLKKEFIEGESFICSIFRVRNQHKKLCLFCATRIVNALHCIELVSC